MNNQNAKADNGKPKLSLVPTEIINCIARVREFGTAKYKDPDNWKNVEKQRYIDALYRHLLEYIKDNHAVDDESGLPALWHIACNLAFLCEFDKVERETAKINDDISKLNENKSKEKFSSHFYPIEGTMIYNAIVPCEDKTIYCMFKAGNDGRIIYRECADENGTIILNCKKCPLWDFPSCECTIQKQIRRGEAK